MLQERWIQYPHAMRILERQAGLVDYPLHDRMPCLVVYGDTAMGKTHIIQKFLRDNHAHFDQRLGKTCARIVLIQMPPMPSEQDLLKNPGRDGGVFALASVVTILGHQIRAWPGRRC